MDTVGRIIWFFDGAKLLYIFSAGIFDVMVRNVGVRLQIAMGIVLIFSSKKGKWIFLTMMVCHRMIMGMVVGIVMVCISGS